VKNLHVIILTGLSGSGKSTALRSLEDMGYFCVDNLPASLVAPFAEEIIRKFQDCQSSEKDSPAATAIKYALLVDCRDGAPFSIIEHAREMILGAGLNFALLFIDCTDEVIARRFRETRRKHPLLSKDSDSRSILEALSKERELLQDFRSAAARVIDTSQMNVHELRKAVEDFTEDRKTMLITLQSFGYKYGNPVDVDLLFDIRFLPNPFFDDSLRDQTGLSLQVRDYVIRNPDTLTFLQHLESLFEFLLPRYELEGKQYLSIGIGCTGGKHRSVVVTEELLRRLRERREDRKFYKVQIFHRDIEK
jgi:RNase adapter protein RapZ